MTSSRTIDISQRAQWNSLFALGGTAVFKLPTIASLPARPEMMNHADAAAAGNKRDSHVHVQISVDLDPHHEIALEIKLKECTDDQILAEIARRGIDIKTSVTGESA